MSSNPDDISQWLDPALVTSSTSSSLEEHNVQQQRHEFAYDSQLFPNFATNLEQDASRIQQYPVSGLSEEYFGSGVEPSSGPLRQRRMSREPPRHSGGSQSSSGRTSPVDTKKNLSEKKRRNNIRLGIENLRKKIPAKYSKDANSDPVLLEKVAEYIEDLEKQVKSSSRPASSASTVPAPGGSEPEFEPGPSTSGSDKS